MSLRFTLKLTEIKQETSDAFTFCFKQPAIKKVSYKAGQYLTLIFNVNKRRYIRPYSFSSAPNIDKTLNLTVKRMAGGVVSNYMIDMLKPGDLVEVMPPMGHFVLPENNYIKDKHLIMWGSGSGITPLFSLVKHALQEELVSHITLIYGNKNHETTIFFKELKLLEQNFPKKFAVIHFHTESTFDFANPYFIAGRLTVDKVLGLLPLKNMNKTLHYICGPEGLKMGIKEALLSLNVDSHDIFSEDFELTKNPEDFKDINTQDIELIVNGQARTLEIIRGKSILEAALDAGIDLNYSCQTGDCKLCKGLLSHGQIEQIPDIADLDDGYCLLCCSYPKSKDVKIII